ncbi:hypothetical protein A4X13_0g6984 [Tilletia indica]|uniref:Ada DNA repair metal-binding domain-containing protein n=1 Tax=Tilletia indica TaxID=43049 RepID=A0A8T8SML0_9BASI|nr:hypothetical protein A4X13_0g6984 [Tilletia indica]
MSVPGSAGEPSYGESSQPACACSSGNEQYCPIHHLQFQQQERQHHQQQHQQSSIRDHGTEMQAYPRPLAYPHHISNQRLASIAPNAAVYGSSFDSHPTSSSMADPRSQHVAYVPQNMSSGMLPYQPEGSIRPQVPAYAVSPDAVWAQASSSQLMPAIDVPTEHTTLSQMAPIHDPSSTMFLPQANAGMPAAPLSTTSNATSFGSVQADAYSPTQPAPVSPVEPLSWNMFPPPGHVRPSGTHFPASQNNYPFAFRQQPVGMTSPYSHPLPQLHQHSQPHPQHQHQHQHQHLPQAQPPAMGWAHGGPDTVKAETLPPNSPGLREEAGSGMYRHVSAPSTPIAALESGRAYSLADFRQVPPPAQDMHPSAILTSSPHLASISQIPGPSNMPMFPGSYRAVDLRPATSAGLMSETPSIPYLDRNFSTEQSKYEAVMARSHAADRAFVCGATTTRIYCRPSCASKRPDRTRLQFFCNPNGAGKAEQAGYRPCKRCKPQTPGTADQCVLAVGECARHMVMSARNPSAGGGNDDDDDEIRRGTLKEYSARANLSAFHFHRTFKAVTSVTLGELGKALNTLALHDALGDWIPAPPSQMIGPSSMPMRSSPPPPEDIAHLLIGWSARRARRALGGLAPGVYAAGCPHAMVNHVITESAFGPVALAFLHPIPGADNSRASMMTHIESSPMPVAAEDGGYLQRQNTAPQQLHQSADMLPATPSPNAILLACILGQDAAAVMQRRFPYSQAQPNLAPWVMNIVEELHRTGSREVQLPPEVVGAVRRARVYLEVMHRMTPKRTSSDAGIAAEASSSSTSLDNV